MSIFARRVVPLARATDARRFGHKAANLARLLALGERVPAGVAIAAAWHERLGEAPLDRRLRAQLAIACRGLRWPLAVRSSAVAEDSLGASFAGLLDTRLGVTDFAMLEAAVREVRASGRSGRCVAYARERGIAVGAVGVVVQEQVRARWSGVLFTRDPVDGATACVIESVEGLGDRLVAGEVDPARARVEDGRVTIDVAGSLPEATMRELARRGLAIERAFGAPQDIEWCVDAAGQVCLLQARPMTGAAREAWTNANIAENFPEPVTPLLRSIVLPGYSAYFRELALGYGISPRRVRALEPAFAHVAGVHGGHLYYNLTAIHAILSLVPWGGKLAAAFNRFTGAAGTEPAAAPHLSMAGRWWELARIAFAVARRYAGVQRRVRRFEQRVEAYASRTHPDTLGVAGPPALRDALDGFLRIRLAQWNDAALADAAAMVCYALLGRALQPLGARAEGITHDLLKGLPGLASAQPVEALWELSREAARDPALAAMLRSNDAQAALEALQGGAWPDFHARFVQYLEQWGFRYSRELMLTAPTPREDPRAMVAILQSYLRDSGAGPGAVSRAQCASRIQATHAAARALTPNGWLRAMPFSAAGRMRIVLRATQGAIRLRERARMKQALLYTRLRGVALASGARLVSTGAIGRAEDVFFLAIDELRAGLDGGSVPDADELNRRRLAHAQAHAGSPPDTFRLARGAAWDGASMASRGASSGALRGTAACGGRCEGEARVIADVAGIAELRAGEVLVTRQTDPGWAAVFFMAKGLVVERGGMLSHGAIIAREYGIPAVVGVAGAIDRIRSGERIRIDGDLGVVELAGG